MYFPIPLMAYGRDIVEERYSAVYGFSFSLSSLFCEWHLFGSRLSPLSTRTECSPADILLLRTEGNTFVERFETTRCVIARSAIVCVAVNINVLVYEILERISERMYIFFLSHEHSFQTTLILVASHIILSRSETISETPIPNLIQYKSFLG